MLSKREQTALKQFRITLEKELTDNLVEVRLFGPKARGDAREDSDLDVLVVISNGDWHMCDVVYGIATDILLETDICISPKVINRKEYDHLCKVKASFIENVIRDGIAV